MMRFKVDGQIISLIKFEQPVADSVDYLAAEFEFSDDWSGAVKTAYFQQGVIRNSFVLTEDKISADKHLNLTSGQWEVSVVGIKGSTDNAIKITTNTANIRVINSGIRGGNSVEVSTSQGEQIISAVSEIANSVKDVSNHAQEQLDLVRTQILEQVEAVSSGIEDLHRDLALLEQEGYPMASIQDAVNTWAESKVSSQVIKNALGYEPADKADVEWKYTKVGLDIGLIRAKIEGRLYDFVTDNAAAYEKIVPAGALKYAFLDKVGAKSLVWNQLIRDPEILNIGSFGVTAHSGRTIENGVLTATINNSNCQIYQAGHTKIVGHKYYLAFDVMPTNGWFAYCGLHDNAETVERHYTADGVWNKVRQVRTFKAGTNPDQFGFYVYFNSNDPSNQIKFRNPIVCDLTLMFGAGNEPTARVFEQMFTAERYEHCDPVLRNYEPRKILCIGAEEYVGKTIELSEIIGKYFPDGMKSVGVVYDEIDLENGKAVKRVRSVDLGTLTWTKPANTVRFFAAIQDPFVQNRNDVPQNVLCEIGETIAFNNLNTGGGRGVALTSTKNFNVSMPQYDNMTADQFKAAVSGVKMYYEMAEREDVDITETLDRQLIVETGGWITMESAYFDAHVPLPNTETFMVKL